MQEIWIFLGKTAILFVTFVLIVGFVSYLISKAQTKSNLEIDSLTDRWQDIELWLKSYVLGKSDFKKELKKQRKLEKKKPDPVGHVFVIDFKGDIQASQVENLREEVTAILQVADPSDEVVVKIESPGGAVSGYGHAASQLLRFRDAGVPLTACVDEVAASGGYLMASVASKILSAPFAIVGSIGVVASIPNFYRLLKKNDVDYHEYTSGEFKRTVSLLGEITEKGEKKFLEQLEETHVLFKEFVSAHRPQIDLKQVATGEYWFGQRALELKLVDHIQTSDDYLLQAREAKRAVLSVKYQEKKKLSEKLSNVLGRVVETTVNKLFEKMSRHIPF